MNKYEKACKEFLKGCSCADDGNPEECEECTNAFLKHIKTLAGKEKYPINSKQYYEIILRGEHWL